MRRDIVRRLALAVLVLSLAPPSARAENAATDTARPDQAADHVQMTRSVRVYAQPRARSSLNRGRVSRAARFRVLERSGRGNGCRGDWLRIAEESWICSRATKQTEAEPSTATSPRLRPSRLLPHTYVVMNQAHAHKTLRDAIADVNGKPLAGTTGFPLKDRRRVDGITYTRTSRGWVRGRRARIVSPSTFRGVVIDSDKKLPLAFVKRRRAPRYDERGKRRRIRPRPRQFFLGTVGEQTRIGRHLLRSDANGDYYRTRDIGVVAVSPRPASVGPDDRWLDVDMSQQVLVAYQGDRPLFATLVSTARTATPKGVFRINKKRAFARMRSGFGGPNSWDVLTPWVMTLRGPIAMHAAYWHKQYGKRRSHGCINLSPADARRIWEFSHPALPPGWMRINATENRPGTVIRIR